jgi:hypothetical protein
MASRAFTARLIRQFSNWLASTRIDQTPPASTVSILMLSGTVRRIRSDKPAISVLTETDVGCNGWRRENARS